MEHSIFVWLVVYRPFPTSNHNVWCPRWHQARLYIVRFLHQTTTVASSIYFGNRCISSVSYIKPQRSNVVDVTNTVVYRPFPTSNHNLTSEINYIAKLYIVRFLHQTTTNLCNLLTTIVLYIVRFLHQTTTTCRISIDLLCCISSVSYIKPQRTSRCYADY